MSNRRGPNTGMRVAAKFEAVVDRRLNRRYRIKNRRLHRRIDQINSHPPLKLMSTWLFLQYPVYVRRPTGVINMEACLS